MGKKVILIYDTPEIGWNPIAKIKLNRMNNITTDLTIRYDVVKERLRPIIESFDKLIHPNLAKIYPLEILCNATTNRCRVQNGTRIYYSDTNHMVPEHVHTLFGDALRKALFKSE